MDIHPKRESAKSYHGYEKNSGQRENETHFQAKSEFKTANDKRFADSGKTDCTMTISDKTVNDSSSAKSCSSASQFLAPKFTSVKTTRLKRGKKKRKLTLSDIQHSAGVCNISDIVLSGTERNSSSAIDIAMADHKSVATDTELLAFKHGVCGQHGTTGKPSFSKNATHTNQSGVRAHTFPADRLAEQRDSTGLVKEVSDDSRDIVNSAPGEHREAGHGSTAQPAKASVSHSLPKSSLAQKPCIGKLLKTKHNRCHNPIIYKKTRIKRMTELLKRCRHAYSDIIDFEDSCGHVLAWYVQSSQKYGVSYQKEGQSKQTHAHCDKSVTPTETRQEGGPLPGRGLCLPDNARKGNKCQSNRSLFTRHASEGNEGEQYVSRDQSESALHANVSDSKRKKEDAKNLDPTEKKPSEIMPKPKASGLESQMMNHQEETNQYKALRYDDDNEVQVCYGISNRSVHKVNKAHPADAEDLQSAGKDITEDKTDLHSERGKRINERQCSFSQRNNQIEEPHCTHAKKRTFHSKATESTIHSNQHVEVPTNDAHNKSMQVDANQRTQSTYKVMKRDPEDLHKAHSLSLKEYMEDEGKMTRENSDNDHTPFTKRPVAETLDEFLENYVMPAKVQRKTCSESSFTDKEPIFSIAQSGAAQLDPQSVESVEYSKANETIDTSQSELPTVSTMDDIQKSVSMRTPLPFLKELCGTHRVKSDINKKSKSAGVHPKVTPLTRTRIFTLKTCLSAFDKQTTEAKIPLPLMEELKGVLRKRQGQYEDTKGHHQNSSAMVDNVGIHNDYIQKHIATKNTPSVPVNQPNLEESRNAAMSDAAHEVMTDIQMLSSQPIKKPRGGTIVSHQEAIINDSTSEPDKSFGSKDVTANSHIQTCRRVATHHIGAHRGGISPTTLSRIKGFVDIPVFSSDHKCYQIYNVDDSQAAQNDPKNYVHGTLDINEVDICSCNVTGRGSEELESMNQIKSSTPATHKNQFEKSPKSSLNMIEDRQIKTDENTTFERNKTSQSLFNLPITINKMLSKRERVECTRDASLDFGPSSSHPFQSSCIQFESSHLPSTLCFADDISPDSTVTSMELISAWQPSGSLLQRAPNPQTWTSVQCSSADNKNYSDSSPSQSYLKNPTEGMLCSPMVFNNAVCGQEEGRQWSTFETSGEVCETFRSNEAIKEQDQKQCGYCSHHTSSDRFDDQKEKPTFSKEKQTRRSVADLVQQFQTIIVGERNANNVIQSSKYPTSFDNADHQKQQSSSDSAVGHTQPPNMANTEISKLVSVVPNNATETTLHRNTSVLKVSDHSFKSVDCAEGPCERCLSCTQCQDMALPLQSEMFDFLSGDSSKLSLNTAFSTTPRQTPEKSLVAETSDVCNVQDEETNRSTTTKEIELCRKALSRSHLLSLDVSSPVADMELMHSDNSDSEQFHRTLDIKSTGSACTMPLKLHIPDVQQEETYLSANSHTYFESVSKDTMELTRLNLEAMSEENEQATHSSDLSLTAEDVSTPGHCKNRQYRDIEHISHWLSSIFLHNKELYIPNTDSENSSLAVLGKCVEYSNSKTTVAKKLDSRLSAQTRQFPSVKYEINKCSVGTKGEIETWEEEKDSEINTGFKQRSEEVEPDHCAVQNDFRTARVKQRHSPISYFEAVPTETKKSNGVSCKGLKDSASNDTGEQTTSCSEASFVSARSMGELPIIDQFLPLAKQLENEKKMSVTKNEDNVKEKDGIGLNQTERAWDSQELEKIQLHSGKKRPKLSDPAIQMLLNSYKLIGGFVQVVLDHRESGTPVFMTEVKKCLDTCGYSENGYSDRESANNLERTFIATKPNAEEYTENTENDDTGLNMMATRNTSNVADEVNSKGQAMATREALTNKSSVEKANSEQPLQPSQDVSKNQKSLYDTSNMAHNKNKLKSPTRKAKKTNPLDINHIERNLLKEDSKLRLSNLWHRQVVPESADAPVSNVCKQCQTTNSVPLPASLFMREQTLFCPLLSDQTGHVCPSTSSGSSFKGVPISNITDMTQSDNMLIKQRQLTFDRPSDTHQYLSERVLEYSHTHNSPRSNHVSKTIKDIKKGVYSENRPQFEVQCLTEKRHTNKNYSIDEEVAYITHSSQCRPSTSRKKTDSETYNQWINSQKTSYSNIISKHPTPYSFSSVNVLCENNLDQGFSEYSASCSVDVSREQNTEMKCDHMSLQDQTSHGERFTLPENRKRRGDIVSSTKGSDAATKAEQQHHGMQHHNAKREYESLSPMCAFPEAHGPVMKERFQNHRGSNRRNERKDQETLDESNKPGPNGNNGQTSYQSSVQNKDESRFCPYLGQNGKLGNLTPSARINDGNGFAEDDTIHEARRGNICYLLSLLEKVHISLQRMVNKCENKKTETIPTKLNKISLLHSSFKNKGELGTEDEAMKKALETLLGNALQNVHKLRTQITSPSSLPSYTTFSEPNENTDLNASDLVTPVHQGKVNSASVSAACGNIAHTAILSTEEAEIESCSRKFATDNDPIDYLTPIPEDCAFLNAGEKSLPNMTEDNIKTTDACQKFEILRHDNSKEKELAGKIEIMCRFLQISANCVTDDNFVDRMYKTLTKQNDSSGCVCESSTTQEYDSVGKECTGIVSNRDGRRNGVFSNTQASCTGTEDSNGQTVFQSPSSDIFPVPSLQHGMQVIDTAQLPQMFPKQDQEKEDSKQCISPEPSEYDEQDETNIIENKCKTVQATPVLVKEKQGETSGAAEYKRLSNTPCGDWYIVDDVLPHVFHCVLSPLRKALPARSFEHLLKQTSSVDPTANDPPPSGISMYTIEEHPNWHSVLSVAASNGTEQVGQGFNTSTLSTGESKHDGKTVSLNINNYNRTKRKKREAKDNCIKSLGSHPHNQKPVIPDNNSSSSLFDSFPTAAHPTSKNRNAFPKHKPVVYTLGPKYMQTDLKTNVSTEEILHSTDKHRHCKQLSENSYLPRNDAEIQQAVYSNRNYTQSASSADCLQQTAFIPPGKTAHQSAFRTTGKGNACSARGAKGYALVKQGNASTWTEPVFIDRHVFSSPVERHNHPNNNSNQRGHQVTADTQRTKDIFSNFNMNGSPGTNTCTEIGSHKLRLLQTRKRLGHVVDAESTGSQRQGFVVSPLDEANAIYVSMCVVSETVDPITGNSLLKVTGTDTSESERVLNPVSNLLRQQRICKPIDKKAKATVLSERRRQQGLLSTNQNASNKAPENVAANHTAQTRSPLEISAPARVTVSPHEPNGLASDPRRTLLLSEKQKVSRIDNSKLVFPTATVPARTRSAMFSPECNSRECMSVRDKIDLFTTKIKNHSKPETCRNHVHVGSNADGTVKGMCRMYQRVKKKQFDLGGRKHENTPCSTSANADHVIGEKPSQQFDNDFKGNKDLLENTDSDCLLYESTETHYCPSSDISVRNNKSAVDNDQPMESNAQMPSIRLEQRKECGDDVSIEGTPSVHEVVICDCGKKSFSNVVSTKPLNATCDCGKKSPNNVDSTQLLYEESDNDIESQCFSVTSVENMFEGSCSFMQTEDCTTGQSSFYSIGNSDSFTSSGESWVTARQDYITQSRRSESSSNIQHETKVQNACSNTDIKKKTKQSACHFYPVSVFNNSSQNRSVNSVNTCSYLGILEEMGKHNISNESFAGVQDRCGLTHLSCTEGTNTTEAHHRRCVQNADIYHHVTDCYQDYSGQRPRFPSAAKYSHYCAKLVHHETQTESAKLKSKPSSEKPSCQQGKNEIAFSDSMLAVSAFPVLNLPKYVSKVAKHFLTPANSAQKTPKVCDNHLSANADSRTSERKTHGVEIFKHNASEKSVATNKNAIDEDTRQTDTYSREGKVVQTSHVKKHYIPRSMTEKHNFQHTNNPVIMTKCDEKRRVSTLFEKDQKLREKEPKTRDTDMSEDTSIMKQYNTSLSRRKSAGQNHQELELVTDSAPQRIKIKEENKLRNLYKITIGLEAEDDVKSGSVSSSKHVSLTVGSINVSTNAKGHSADEYQQRRNSQDQARCSVGSGMSHISVPAFDRQGKEYHFQHYNRCGSESEHRESYSFNNDKMKKKQKVPQNDTLDVLCKPDSGNKKGASSEISDNEITVIKNTHLLPAFGAEDKPHAESSTCDSSASPVGITIQSSQVFRSNKRQEHNALALKDLSSNLSVIKTTALPLSEDRFETSKGVRSRNSPAKNIESYTSGGGKNTRHSDKTMVTLRSASRQESVGVNTDLSSFDSGRSNIGYTSNMKHEREDKERQSKYITYVNDNVTDKVNPGTLDSVGAKYLATKSDQVLNLDSPCKSIQNRSVHHRCVTGNGSLHNLKVPSDRSKKIENKRDISDNHGQTVAGHMEFAPTDTKENQKEGNSTDHDQETFETENRKSVKQESKEEKKENKLKCCKDQHKHKRAKCREQPLPVAKIEIVKPKSGTHCVTKMPTVVHGSPRYHKGDCFYDTNEEEQGDISFVSPIAHYTPKKNEHKCDTQQIIKREAANLAANILNKCVNIAMTSFGVKHARVCHTDGCAGDHIPRAHHHTNSVHPKKFQHENKSMKASSCAHRLQHIMPGIVCRSEKFLQSQGKKTETQQKRKYNIGNIEGPNDNSKIPKPRSRIYSTTTDRKQNSTTLKGKESRKTGEFECEPLSRRNLCLSTEFTYDKLKSMGRSRNVAPSSECDRAYRHRSPKETEKCAEYKCVPAAGSHGLESEESLLQTSCEKKADIEEKHGWLSISAATKYPDLLSPSADPVPKVFQNCQHKTEKSHANLSDGKAFSGQCVTLNESFFARAANDLFPRRKSKPTKDAHLIVKHSPDCYRKQSAVSRPTSDFQHIFQQAYSQQCPRHKHIVSKTGKNNCNSVCHYQSRQKAPSVFCCASVSDSSLEVKACGPFSLNNKQCNLYPSRRQRMYENHRKTNSRLLGIEERIITGSKGNEVAQLPCNWAKNGSRKDKHYNHTSFHRKCLLIANNENKDMNSNTKRSKFRIVAEPSLNKEIPPSFKIEVSPPSVHSSSTSVTRLIQMNETLDPDPSAKLTLTEFKRKKGHIGTATLQHSFPKCALKDCTRVCSTSSKIQLSSMRVVSSTSDTLSSDGRKITIGTTSMQTMKTKTNPSGGNAAEFSVKTKSPKKSHPSSPRTYCVDAVIKSKHKSPVAHYVCQTDTCIQTVLPDDTLGQHFENSCKEKAAPCSMHFKRKLSAASSHSITDMTLQQCKKRGSSTDTGLLACIATSTTTLCAPEEHKLQRSSVFGIKIDESKQHDFAGVRTQQTVCSESNSQCINQMKKTFQSHKKPIHRCQHRQVMSEMISSDSAMSVMSASLINLKQELPNRKRARKKARMGIQNYRLAQKSDTSVVSIISGHSNSSDGENQLITTRNFRCKKNTKVKRLSCPINGSTTRLRRARQILRAQKKLSRQAHKTQAILNNAIQATRREIIAEKKRSQHKQLQIALKTAEQKRLKSRPSVQCVICRRLGHSSTSFESSVCRVESSSPHGRPSVTSEECTCSCVSVSLRQCQSSSSAGNSSRTGTCVSVVSKDNQVCCLCSGRTSCPPLVRKQPVVDSICSSCVQVTCRNQGTEPSKKTKATYSGYSTKLFKLNGGDHCFPRKCFSSQSVLETWDVHRSGSKHACQCSKSDCSISYMASEADSSSGTHGGDVKLVCMGKSHSRTLLSNDKGNKSLILQTHRQYLSNLQQLAERLASSAVRNADRHRSGEANCHLRICRSQLDPCYLLTLKDMSRMVAAVCMTATERGITRRWRSFCSLFLKPGEQVSLTTRRNTANNSSPDRQSCYTMFHQKVSDRPIALTNPCTRRTLWKENIVEKNKIRPPEENPMAFTENDRKTRKRTGIQSACANMTSGNSDRHHIATDFQTRYRDNSNGQLTDFSVSSSTLENSSTEDDSSQETWLKNKAVKTFNTALKPRISDTTSFKSCHNSTMFHFRQPSRSLSQRDAQSTYLSESIIIPDHRAVARFGHQSHNHSNLHKPWKSQGHRCHTILRTAKMGPPPYSENCRLEDLPKTTTYKSYSLLHQSKPRSEYHDVVSNDSSAFCSTLSKDSLQRQKRRDAKIFMSTLPEDAQKSLRRRRDRLQRDTAECQAGTNHQHDKVNISPHQHPCRLKETQSFTSHPFPNRDSKAKIRKEGHEINAEQNLWDGTINKSRHHSKECALAKNEIRTLTHNSVRHNFCNNHKDVDKTRHTDVCLHHKNNHADHFKSNIEAVIDTFVPCARGQGDSPHSQACRKHRHSEVRDKSHHIHAHRENKRGKCGLEDCHHSYNNTVACSSQGDGQLDRCHCANQHQSDSRQELSCLGKSVRAVNQHESQGESCTCLHYVSQDGSPDTTHPYMASQRKETRQRSPLCSNNKTNLVAVPSTMKGDTALGDWPASCGKPREGARRNLRSGSICEGHDSKPNYSSRTGCLGDNAGDTLPSTSRAEQHVSSPRRLRSEVRQCVERNMRRLCKACPQDVARMSYQHMLHVNGSILDKLQTASRWDADSVNRAFRDAVYQCYLHYHQPDLCSLSNNSCLHFPKFAHHHGRH